MSAEQSNSSVAFGDRAILKYIRRFEEGVNPGVEIGRLLGERLRFPHERANGGGLEYRAATGSVPATVVSLEEFVPNEGDGWNYVVDGSSTGWRRRWPTPTTRSCA